MANEGAASEVPMTTADHRCSGLTTVLFDGDAKLGGSAPHTTEPTHGRHTNPSDYGYAKP